MVARLGERDHPPIPAPRRMRPILGHTRLTAAALATIRRVVDEDEAFRSRVAAAATEEDLGRTSWLWLTRPEGWADEVGELESGNARQAAAAEEALAARRATRRVAALEGEIAELNDRLSREKVVAKRSADEATAERRFRRDTEEARVNAVAELEAARSQIASLEHLVAESRAASERADVQLRRATAERDSLAEELEVVRRQSAHGRDANDRRAAALSIAVTDAADAARRLGVALADAAALLVADQSVGERSPAGFEEAATEVIADPSSPGEISPPPATTASGPRATGTLPSSTRPVGRAPVRVPLALPPAVLEESADAVAHLVRAPGALLVVDGYNVSFCGWPDAAISDQRGRLVGALSELAARNNLAVHVVFDGPRDEELPPAPGAPRRPVRVVFSPPGVDADEVIIDVVASLPAHRPVLVATSDRRVQEEVRRRGANVVTSPQLLALLGRGTERRP